MYGPVVRALRAQTSSAFGLRNCARRARTTGLLDSIYIDECSVPAGNAQNSEIVGHPLGCRYIQRLISQYVYRSEKGETGDFSGHRTR